jgi:hypothetical protein
LNPKLRFLFNTNHTIYQKKESIFDMSSNVLADKDINAPATNGAPAEGAKDVKSMEYHRQVLQSKLNEDQYVLLVFDTPPFSLAPTNKSTRGKQTYISPSDNIMSPCTAKLSAYRSKQVGK